MRTNALKHELAGGGTAVGTMALAFPGPWLGPIAAAAGASFIVLDMEHSGWSLESVGATVAGCRTTSITPIVRVPTQEQRYLAGALDVGAQGVMVPMVQDADQARHVVSCVKYPPAGSRGAAFGIAHDGFRPGDPARTMRETNAESMVIAQVETARGVANVDAIAAVDGIDVVWVGHFDLSSSLGVPGRFDEPRYLDAVERVLTACERANTPVGFLAAAVTDARALLARGVRCLAYGLDVGLYQSALRDGLAAARDAAASGPDRADP